jgi:hypothetical protein
MAAKMVQLNFESIRLLGNLLDHQWLFFWLIEHSILIILGAILALRSLRRR